MKIITLAAALILFCSSFIPDKKNTGTDPLYNVKWTLVKLLDNTGKETTVNPGSFIRFNAAKKSAGGNGGCNAFGSTLAVNGHTIHITEMISTKMFCDGIQNAEDAYFKALGRVDRYELKGKELFLYQGEKLVMEFKGE